jgi:hypothetical protein
MSVGYIHIFLLEVKTQISYYYNIYTEVRRSAEPATCVGQRLSHTTDYQPGGKETDGTQSS